MGHCGSVCNVVVSMCFWFPLSDLFFLGKPAWTLELDYGIQNFTTRSHKIMHSTVRYPFAPISTQSNPVCRIRLCNRTCRIMLVHLHVFHFLSHSDSHNACIESWLKVLWFLHFANLVKGPFFSSTIWKLGLPMVQLAIDSTSLDIYIYICTHTHRHAYKQRC